MSKKEEPKINIPNYIAIESILGAACFLTSKSPNHKYIFAHEYESMIIPAIINNQFSLFRNEKNEPIAFISWAVVNNDVENRLLEGNAKLKPQDWKSGEKNYIIDVISPFVPTIKILKEFSQNQFKDKEISILKPNKDKKGSNIAIQLPEFLKDH